jgi:hypothetical protein
MKSLIDLNRITYISGMFGIACLLVGLISSFLTQTGEAVTVNSNCDTGYVEKDESKPFEYNGSETIVKAIVKAGQDCFPLKINSPNDGCYKANGLGTSSVKVSRIGEPSPSCQEISFVEFYAGQVETPETPTETPETPTETPETPTETPATPVTPTATESKPPPIENPTPTSPSKPKRTPPATLPPPTPFPGSPPPQALIPQTGSVLGLVPGANALAVILGFGLIGLGIAFYGIVTRLKGK